jgi:hypothetical protein
MWNRIKILSVSSSVDIRYQILSRFIDLFHTCGRTDDNHPLCALCANSAYMYITYIQSGAEATWLSAFNLLPIVSSDFCVTLYIIIICTWLYQGFMNRQLDNVLRIDPVGAASTLGYHAVTSSCFHVWTSPRACPQPALWYCCVLYLIRNVDIRCDPSWLIGFLLTIYQT